MLLLPLVLGIAASRPDPWQAVLGIAAVSGYVTSATIQAWSRARRAAAYRPPILVWGSILMASGLVLAVAFPPLLLTLVVLVPTGAVVLIGARPGHRRDAVNSLAQVAQALVLVPAAALVSGSADAGSVAVATCVAATYLVGSVLVVRSVLSERGNAGFAAGSIAFHAAALAAAVAASVLATLPVAYAAVAAWLLVRAAALPRVQARRAGGPHPLRPVHVGVVEIVSSLLVILAAVVGGA